MSTVNRVGVELMSKRLLAVVKDVKDINFSVNPSKVSGFPFKGSFDFKGQRSSGEVSYSVKFDGYKRVELDFKAPRRSSYGIYNGIKVNGVPPDYLCLGFDINAPSLFGAQAFFDLKVEIKYGRDTFEERLSELVKDYEKGFQMFKVGMFKITDLKGDYDRGIIPLAFFSKDIQSLYMPVVERYTSSVPNVYWDTKDYSSERDVTHFGLLFFNYMRAIPIKSAKVAFSKEGEDYIAEAVLQTMNRSAY